MKKLILILSSLLIPLVGLIAGIKYLFTTSRRRYGGVLFILGLVSIIVWAAIIAGASSSGPKDHAEPSLTPQEIKAQAVKIEWDPLFRNIETHVGKVVNFRGEIVQVVIAGDDRYDLRIAMNGNYDHMVYVIYKGGRVLEGDNVEIWGKVNGLYSYESIFGAKITLPEINSFIGIVKN